MVGVIKIHKLDRCSDSDTDTDTDTDKDYTNVRTGLVNEPL